MTPDASLPAEADSRDPLEELAESFLERLRRGERPTVEEYVDGHPQLARPIQELFPTLLALEELGPADEAEKGTLPAVDCRELKRLGEYRILGEIGRGGMGIVYEAEQESLGRRVALKVLPFKAFADEVQLERFRLEARAAARLHHTNIVPVFGVGEDEGVHYYAMQYIHGQSLADVLAEVKRLREGRSPPVLEPDGPVDSAADVAGRLVSGEWKAEVEAEKETPAADWRHHRAPTETVVVQDVRGLSTEVGSSGNPLAGDASTTSVGDRNEPYYRSVARLGLQVAEALSYAHREGILHRDIKPANLLLDMRGVVCSPGPSSSIRPCRTSRIEPRCSSTSAISTTPYTISAARSSWLRTTTSSWRSADSSSFD